MFQDTRGRGVRTPVAVTVLSRAAEPGACKTRLARDVGPVAAAGLHRVLALDAIASAAAWLGRAGTAGSRALVLALTGGREACEALAAEARGVAALRIEDQAGGDLGARMAFALDARLAEGALASVVVGTDAPDLSEVLPAIAEALRSAPVAVVPARDGGYVALGTTVPLGASLHGIEWGTPSVLEQTRAALSRAGLPLAVAGEPVDDVDDRDGLARLARDLARRRLSAPRTARWLEEQRGRGPGA